MKVSHEPEDFEILPLHSDPEVMAGTVVFIGTRVPVNALWGNLETGATLDEFLDWFPTVSREQAETVLRHAFRHLAKVTEQVDPQGK